MSRILNHLGIYATTTELTVRVLDEKGSPVPEAKVIFEVLNYSGFGMVATVTSDTQGKATLKTGHGSLHVCASKDKFYGEIMAEAGSGTEYQLTLHEKIGDMEEWKDLTVYAPEDTKDSSCDITEEQKQHGAVRVKEAADYRAQKIQEFYEKTYAEQVFSAVPAEEEKDWEDIMKKSCGNIAEIAKFATLNCEDRYPEQFKLAILKTLREKDYWDITAEILDEYCQASASFYDTYSRSEQEIFQDYILCPRVSYEMLVPSRNVINSFFSEAKKAAIRNNPETLPDRVNELVETRKELEYGGLITSARGCLEGGIGSVHSKQVLCVQIYRTLGIPARLHPLDRVLEYYADGAFHALGKKKENRSASVIVKQPQSISG